VPVLRNLFVNLGAELSRWGVCFLLVISNINNIFEKSLTAPLSIYALLPNNRMYSFEGVHYQQNKKFN